MTAYVGYEPEERVTVIVDDPVSTPGGSAWPGPVVLLHPTPPEPSSVIGTYRGWGELVTVHEMAHVAHIARPSRNPRLRWLVRLVQIPIVIPYPRWALEGYATLIEGRLTGGGRPHGVWRPAVLRTWALEGALPDYGELDGLEGFMGGHMAYLAGSAYLEWLVDRSGEESLPKVWRRATARRRRSFAEAFAGVLGAPPSELYGEFTVDVTERALAVEDAVQGAGIERGEWIQRLVGWSADPAVSPDGEHLAIVRRPAADEAAEVVVWSTAPDTLAAEEREERERALELDPEDVPAVQWRPRPKEAVARLGPVGGRGHSVPRWLPGGNSLLVVRWEGLGDGRLRPDLFEWRWRDGSLRRVTRGEAVREADPDPDGRTAVGTRCAGGTCDLVRIDLVSGEVALLAAGEVGGPSYHGARVGPGGRIAVSVFEEGAWRLALLHPEGRELRALVPAGAPVRFDAEWAGADAVVAVSEAGGIHDLERIDVATGATRRLTRVVTAALSPAPAPDGGVFFLHLTSRGMDVRRVDGAPLEEGAPAIDPGLVPARPAVPTEAPELSRRELPPARPYRPGWPAPLVLPAGTVGPAGWNGGLTLHGSDPIGRLRWAADAVWGSESAWRGGAAAVAWHGWRPEVTAHAFRARQRPSEQDLDGPPPAGLDVELTGGLLQARLRWAYGASRRSLRAGAAVVRLETPSLVGAARGHGFAEAAGAWLQTIGGWRLVERARLHAALGETDGEGWARGLARIGLEIGRGEYALVVDALYGIADAGPDGFEAFAFGGSAPPHLDSALLSQRLHDPALPAGWGIGTRAASVRLAWRSGFGETYFRWTSAGESIGSWKRAMGSEVSLGSSPVPFLSIPEIDFALGVARLLDPPLDGETRLYGSLRYRP
ncbi:MAG: hypothetical protein R3199_09325 [Gemmatimonadota bacterium]|nr:hypothetical protein [Gemmatimonadota bacterium]